MEKSLPLDMEFILPLTW